MADTTNIEWADSTFNGWMGCTKVSPACDSCYAERATPVRARKVLWGAGQARARTTESWNHPVSWQRNAAAFQLEHGRRRRVFGFSLGDWLDNEVPLAWFVDFLRLIRATPDLDWLLLSKRIGNLRKRLTEAGDFVHAGEGDGDLLAWITMWQWGDPPPNVWLGATVVTQAEADRDVVKLLTAPARVRFLSIEPMLEAINLTRWLWHCCGNFQAGSEDDGLPGGACCGRPERSNVLDWIITGGESGPKARPLHPGWVRSIRDQCSAAGVAFLHKQNGEWASVSEVAGAGQHYYFPDGATVRRVGKANAGRTLDGFTHTEFPTP